jgi:hypothetical protein
VPVCWTQIGEFLTNKDQVLSRRTEHFKLRLNERMIRDQPPDQVDFRERI